MVTQRGLLIVQQEQLLRLAVSDYIDRIVDGRGLRQRVITQSRPRAVMSVFGNEVDIDQHLMMCIVDTVKMVLAVSSLEISSKG